MVRLSAASLSVRLKSAFKVCICNWMYVSMWKNVLFGLCLSVLSCVVCDGDGNVMIMKY